MCFLWVMAQTLLFRMAPARAVVPRRELARRPRVNSAAGAGVARPGAFNSVEELSAAAKEAWEDLPMDLIRHAIPKFRSRSPPSRSRRAVSSHKVLFARMGALSLFFCIEIDENYGTPSQMNPLYDAKDSISISRFVFPL